MSGAQALQQQQQQQPEDREQVVVAEGDVWELANRERLQQLQQEHQQQVRRHCMMWVCQRVGASWCGLKTVCSRTRVL